MSTNLSTLLARTRRYLNETTAARWTDAELTSYINEAITFVQGEIERANPDWFIRIATFTASAGEFQVASPSDIWGNKIRNMWCYPSSTVATGMGYRVTPGQMEWVLQNSYYSGLTPESYVMLAGYLRWAPMLTYNSTFRYVYAKKEGSLAVAGDALDRISDEYTDLIAMYAAMIAYEKVGGDTAWLNLRLERGLQKMKWDVQPSDPLTIPMVGVDD